jgi:outer membrane protein TolC
MNPRFLAVLIGLLALPALAQGAELDLQKVLSSAEQLAPPLLAARQELAAAEATRLESEGAFDPSWRTRASTVPLGYYQTGRIDTVIQQPTDLAGLSGFAGWRLGAGSFAIYDGKAATAEWGELRAGLALPLLRDRAVDKRRADRAVGQMEPEGAQAALANARLELRRTAALRYWAWVEAGQQLSIAQKLLDMAQQRDAGLAERVKRGDLAELERFDHRRAVLARQAQVVSARQRLQSAALELSLYIRDVKGEPLVPDPGQLPAQLPGAAHLPEAVSEAVQRAQERRPDVQRLAVQQRQLQVQAELADNARLPAVDLQAAVSRDLGSGVASLAPLEFELAVMIDVPVIGRVPAAKVQSARARLARLQAQAQWLRERVAVEVGQVQAEFAAALQRVSLAEQELVQARALADGERKAFALGNSTALVLNLREQAEAEAELRRVVALLDSQRAWAAWQAVTAAE